MDEEEIKRWILEGVKNTAMVHSILLLWSDVHESVKEIMKLLEPAKTESQKKTLSEVSPPRQNSNAAIGTRQMRSIGKLEK